MLFAILIYLAAINVAGFVAFAWDKYCASNDRWRVPESTLLGLAAVGGSIGAIVASRQLRHKTQKQPFKTILYAIAVLQFMAVVGVLALGIAI